MNLDLRRGRYRIEAAALSALLTFARVLPISWAPSFGRALGWFAFDVLRYKRRITLSNIELALGGQYDFSERKKLARRSYQSFGSLALEFLVMPRLPAARLREHIELDNVIVLRDALDLGHGALLITGHLGNWELTVAALAAAGLRMSGYVGRLHNPYVDRLVNDIRRSIGEETIHEGVVVTGVLRALRANRVMAMVSDQYEPAKRHYVSFFGRPVSVAAGPASIARRTGVPLVFVTCARVGTLRIHATFRRVEYETTDNEELDILTITQALFDELESGVRRYPDQYFWMHNRWRPIPDHVKLSEANRAFLRQRLPSTALPPM